MSQDVVGRLSNPARGRGTRPEGDTKAASSVFLLAVSRAFLMAVNAQDRIGTVLFSRAMLNIMNRARDC
jgi:hypothetical protein